MSTSKFLPVATAIELVTGRRLHPATCWRWGTRGIDGVKLKTWMVGGRRCTTVEAVQDFICKRTVEATAGADAGEVKRELKAELARS